MVKSRVKIPSNYQSLDRALQSKISGVSVSESEVDSLLEEGRHYFVLFHKN